MSAYKIVFTDLAAGFAKARSSLAAVEERVRGEIAAILMDDVPLEQLLFHVVEMPDGTEYYCSPARTGDDIVLVVDTCSLDEFEPTRGMLAGAKIGVPRPDSE